MARDPNAHGSNHVTINSFFMGFIDDLYIQFLTIEGEESKYISLEI